MVEERLSLTTLDINSPTLIGYHDQYLNQTFLFMALANLFIGKQKQDV